MLFLGLIHRISLSNKIGKSPCKIFWKIGTMFLKWDFAQLALSWVPSTLSKISHSALNKEALSKFSQNLALSVMKKQVFLCTNETKRWCAIASWWWKGSREKESEKVGWVLIAKSPSIVICSSMPIENVEPMAVNKEPQENSFYSKAFKPMGGGLASIKWRNFLLVHMSTILFSIAFHSQISHAAIFPTILENLCIHKWFTSIMLTKKGAWSLRLVRINVQASNHVCTSFFLSVVYKKACFHDTTCGILRKLWQRFLAWGFMCDLGECARHPRECWLNKVWGILDMCGLTCKLLAMFLS